MKSPCAARLGRAGQTCRLIRPHETSASGLSTVVQCDWCCLYSSEMKVQSLAWHSGLRIWHCCSCSVDPHCSLDLIPGPGTPYALGQPKKEEEEKKKTQVLLNLDSHCPLLFQGEGVSGSAGPQAGSRGSLSLSPATQELCNLRHLPPPSFTFLMRQGYSTGEERSGK